MAGATLYPFIVSTLAWEPRPGQHNLTVCLKATFALAGTEEPPLASQQDGSHDDVLFEQTPHASLYSPSDFVPWKPRADVLLVGQAHAPLGAAVDALIIRLRLGSFSKALRVTGDRAWIDAASREPGGPGPRASSPRPFTRMALRYERALRRGENVVGVAAGDTTRPPPNVDIVVEEGPAETPGFGPIAPSWRALRDPRAMDALLWGQRLRGAKGATPAPAGLDLGVFNAAPRDQQVEEILPGTPLLLENLHPRIPQLRTRLPSLVPSVFYLDPATGQPREVRERIDTLWVDTDREVFVVTWRGVISVAAAASPGLGKVLVAAHPPGATVTFEEVESLTRGSSPEAPARRRRAAPATSAMPQMVDPGAAPFPLATPTAPSVTGSAPIAGAPWAAEAAAPVPRPDQLFAGTMPLGSSLADIVAKAQSGRSPGRAPATMMLERAPLPAAAPAPFPLAEPGASPAHGAPIAGAPWAAEAAAPVPRPDQLFAGTMPLGASLADIVARVKPASSMPVAPLQTPNQAPPATTPPALVFAPPPGGDPAPAPVAAIEPPPPAADPADRPPQTAKPSAVWRVDAPEPTPAAPPGPAPGPPPPDMKNKVYGDFSRKKR